MEAMLHLLRKNGIIAAGLQQDNPSKRARLFAHFMAGLWFFYSIGAWYGSKFVTPDPEAGAAAEPMLFGATFVIWFLAFFAHVSVDLIRKKLKYG